jgi:hypothetical protein
MSPADTMAAATSTAANAMTIFEILILTPSD